MKTQTYDKSPTAEQIARLTGDFTRALVHRSRGELQDIFAEEGVGWEMETFLDRLSGYSCDFAEGDINYPTEYVGLRPLKEQIELVSDEFRIASRQALKLIRNQLPTLPDWMEGWAAFPIEYRLRNSSYSQALYKAVLWMNKVTGNLSGRYAGCLMGGLDPFEDVCPGYTGIDSFAHGFRSRRQSDFLNAFYEKFASRIAIAPVQMGRLRRGQSDRMVREQCRRSRCEYPGTAFDVACLLAMHPTRVGAGETLSANCPGDVYTQDALQTHLIGDLKNQQMAEFRGGIGDSPGLIFLSIGSDMRKDCRHGPVTFSTWDLNSVSI